LCVDVAIHAIGKIYRLIQFAECFVEVWKKCKNSR